MTTAPAPTAHAPTAHAPTAHAQAPRAGRPRVVIIGGGFAGLSVARSLADAPLDVTLLDRHNYHLFQPLLYQVATAGLSPADIASPIRAILHKQRNTTVLLGRAIGIDKDTREVITEAERIPYDYLVVATGARHGYFGRDEWEAVAPGLKKIEDATAIRREILVAFEKAESCTDPEERRRLLNFVIIGGGPTGVEMAGAIAELAKVALAMDFRNIDSREARIILVESGKRVLATFPEDLSEKARLALIRLGVEVRLGTPVTVCDKEGVTIGTEGAGGERIDARTIIWAAGVAASPAAKWLGAAKDRAGRVEVGPDLSLPGHPEIFVIGDTAASTSWDGKPAPGIAPAAKQMGEYVGTLLKARIAGSPAPAPFRYRHLGNLATIGRKAAVADFGFIRLSGRFAWLLWGIVHVFFLIGFRNRLVVLVDWLWAYVTFKRGSRLITGQVG